MSEQKCTTDCTCEDWGEGMHYCPRHKVNKPHIYWEVCQRNKKYFEAWEKGRGPGQLKLDPNKTVVHVRANKQEGPGTELQKLFHRFGIREAAGCKCPQHILQMNKWGPDECQRHMEEIVTWLETEAKRQALPFSRKAAKVLVRIAIWKSRKKQDKEHGNPTQI